MLHFLGGSFLHDLNDLNDLTDLTGWATHVWNLSVGMIVFTNMVVLGLEKYKCWSDCGNECLRTLTSGEILNSYSRVTSSKASAAHLPCEMTRYWYQVAEKKSVLIVVVDLNNTAAKHDASARA